MAIEAVRQLFVAHDAPIVGYNLRDIEIMKALIIPDTVQGAEVSLQHPSEKLIGPNQDLIPAPVLASQIYSSDFE